MTVAELIQKLQSFPGDLPVFVNGYEFGVKDLPEQRVFQANVAIDYNGPDPSYGGPHDVLDKHTTPEDFLKYNVFIDTPPAIRPGVVISRSDPF